MSCSTLHRGRSGRSSQTGSCAVRQALLVRLPELPERRSWPASDRWNADRLVPLEGYEQGAATGQLFNVDTDSRARWKYSRTLQVLERTTAIRNPKPGDGIDCPILPIPS